MLITTEKLIKGYYETIKDRYPDLTLEELTTICRSPFKFLKLQWKNPKLPTIRFMYFGTFIVNDRDKKIERLKVAVEKGIESGRMSTQKIEKLNTIITINQNKKDEENRSKL